VDLYSASSWLHL